MNTISTFLSSIVIVMIFAVSAPVFADQYPYGSYTAKYSYQHNPYNNNAYGEFYNSYATNSTSHSREGYWDIDPTEGISIDENLYRVNSTVVNRYAVHDNGAIGAYGSPTQVQYVSSGYYRGNGGDLRVYDRPYDIVGYSNFIRGGVARSYDTTYSIAPSGLTAGILLLALVLVVVAYAVGKKTA